MAELGFTCRTTGSTTTTTSSTGGGSLDVNRRILLRTGTDFPANTTVDVNAPGSGWFSDGEDVTFSGATDFVEQTQIYRGGQMLLAAENAGSNYDVYFVSASGSLAFEDIIRTNDVVQVWRFDTSVPVPGDIDKIRITRTGSPVPRDTPVIINGPGSGWVQAGDAITWDSATDFVENVSVFVNGILQLPGESAVTNTDVYHVLNSGVLAFEFEIRTNDTIQIWLTKDLTEAGQAI